MWHPFLPVLTYTYPNGQSTSFHVFGFIEPIELSEILGTYSGAFVVNIDQVAVTILAVAAVLAIFAAFVSVITMFLQRPNTWQFVLALVGIIGTANSSDAFYLQTET